MDTLLSVSSFSSEATSPFPGQDISKHARQKHHHTCWLPSKQARQITCSQHSLSFSKLTSSRLSSPTPKLDWRCPTSWWVPKRKELPSRQNWCNPVSLVCFSYHFSVYKIANQLFKKKKKKINELLEITTRSGSPTASGAHSSLTSLSGPSIFLRQYHNIVSALIQTLLRANYMMSSLYNSPHPTHLRGIHQHRRWEGQIRNQY